MTSYNRKSFRRSAITAIIFVAIAGGLILVSISPIALRSLADIHGVNWAKLGNVGQAYGTISALLVVLGLSGVAITLLLQVREYRHSRVQAALNRQHDLVKMAMDDPIYMAVLGSANDFTHRRQASYANLWIQFWLMLWEFGDLTEAELRKVLARELFASSAGRRSWEQFRGVRIRSDEKRQDRKFYDILDQEYNAASASTHPAEPNVPRPRRVVAVCTWIVTATIVGAILRRALRRPR